MTTIETAIYTKAAALLASSPVVPVYLDLLPQSPEYPCVRVQLISDTGQAPATLENQRVQRALVQVDCYAEEGSGTDPYEDASVIAQRVNGHRDGSVGLDGFVGEISGDGSPSTVEVLGCFNQMRHRAYDPDELRVVTISQEYLVYYRPR